MSFTTRTTRPPALAAGTALLALTLAACAPAAGAGPEAAGPPAELRLGYFANVTHAPALVGVSEGIFEARLEAAGTPTLSTQVFNAGPAAIEALNAGAIDATFIGPNPAVNGFIQSDGDALRIVAGTTSGGAQLVVQPGIASAQDLVGANLATPQLGNTQDVALRSWLTSQGLTSPISGGGDVTITPTENAQTLQLFTDGELDGAWLPEPWASRLVVDAGAQVLVDEKDLWPDGQFVTTHLIVSREFLAEHPETVEALLEGLQDSIARLEVDPAGAAAVVNAQLEVAGGAALSDEVLARAFGSLTFSTDPLAGTLGTVLANAVAAGTTTAASIEGIYDLRLLNVLRVASGASPVSAAGLGQE
ncbi:ABC transporter substrate-binding protein [Cellulomonas sp. KRMCY2]|uniref:ABC transporter substrate-binding protein n=1 Tax=Cellulomonas sp. KRMCY2 TaxID=1304865 RepID=UPI00045E8220|nr:ABC transporter substrate-binding protein [Cellulomonas sp. KRMCY2]